MSFAFLIVYLVMTLVRPAEHIPALRAWQLMEVVSALALATAALAAVTGRGPSFRALQIPLMLGFVTWTVVSVAGNSAGSFEAVLGFVKSSGAAFLLVVLNVVSVRRLRIVAVVLIASALVLAWEATSQYKRLAAEEARAFGGDSGLEFGQAQASDAEASIDPSGRVFIAGLFGDPNDLALSLVATLPFALAFLRRRAWLRNTLLVWAPVGLITYGIYVTRSRGGVLALASVLALSLHHRIGTIGAALISGGGLSALLALGFVGDRSMSIDASVEGRIDAWSSGLEMLKSSPAWGVGLGMFTEYHDRAAHSAFVQCFAELGFVGYVLWLALILLTLDDMRLILRGENDQSTELRRWARAIFVALIGFLVGAIFLTRAYDVQFFILLGMGTAAADMARRRGDIVRGRSVPQWIVLASAAAVASIILLWLYMRVFR